MPTFQLLPGDCRAILPTLPAASVRGRFQKGQHWRPARPWWTRAWLFEEYVTRRRSASEIAAAGGCTENNILFWLAKHGIPRRTMREVRAVKRWGPVGEANPMFGRRGALNPNWRGGLTPLRQSIYASLEWRRVAREVRRRDRVCRLCGSDQQTELHHVIPFSEAPLLAIWAPNLILLCRVHHKRMRGKERRWRKRLLRLIAESEVVPVR